MEDRNKQQQHNNKQPKVPQDKDHVVHIYATSKEEEGKEEKLCLLSQ